MNFLENLLQSDQFRNGQGGEDSGNTGLPAFIQNFGSMAGLDDQLFQANLSQAMRNSMQDQSPKPVAAARQSIRQLPTVKVCREDLVDPCNRECCICLEPVELRSSVLRLPCAHLFHPDCVKLWLSQHGNSCPVCRYELPVDNNPEYEAARRERMKGRKPRFARHELGRLSVAQLKAMLPASAAKICFTERQDLIDYLIKAGVVDIVSAPPPVEYRWGELQKLSASALKRTMNDAGVFFDPSEVVEKADMLRIFAGSGRLQILEEVEHDVKAPPFSPDVVVETVQEDHKLTSDRRIDKSVVMEENESSISSQRDKPEAQNATSSGGDGLDEIVLEHASCNITEASSPLPINEDCGGTGEETSIASELKIPTDPLRCSQAAVLDGEPHGVDDILDDELVPDSHDEDRRSALEEGHVDSCATGDNAFPRPLQDEGKSMDIDEAAGMDVDETAYAATHESTDEDIDSDFGRKRLHLQNQSIAQLRNLARSHSIDISECLERVEIVERLVCSLTLTDIQQSPSTRASTEWSCPIENWGISEIRALASLSDVDLSHCRTRDEMVQAINTTAKTRPHVVSYFNSLAPLSELTVSQLRAVAREREIRVSDCLEKGDIIKRLVQETRSHPSRFPR